jgi:hypothetical protein
LNPKNLIGVFLNLKALIGPMPHEPDDLAPAAKDPLRFFLKKTELMILKILRDFLPPAHAQGVKIIAVFPFAHLQSFF